MDFPITVKSIAAGENREPIRPPLFSNKPGDFVKVRLAGDTRTHLGIMIGDVALTFATSHNEETGELTLNRAMYNPGILVPALGRVVYGIESWWGRISSPDDLKDITDADINNVWYVRALMVLEAKAKKENSHEPV